MRTEKLIFSRTYTDILCAVSTKNTTSPNSNNTNVVLILDVMNCISNSDFDLYLFLFPIRYLFFRNT